MTDNEIIKDLKKILELMLYEGDLQRADTVRKTIDLIKRQQAEIERLQADLTRVCAERDARIFTNNFIRAEAIKEFAERLKHSARKMQSSDFSGDFWDRAVLVEDIDNLVKEMVGDNDD